MPQCSHKLEPHNEHSRAECSKTQGPTRSLRRENWRRRVEEPGAEEVPQLLAEWKLDRPICP